MGEDHLQSDQRIRRTHDGFDDARRSTGRHRVRGTSARRAASRQNRYGQRSYRRLVSRLHANLCDRRVDGLSGPEETARQRHDRSAWSAALVHRLHERFLEGQAEGGFYEGANYARRHERDVQAAST